MLMSVPHTYAKMIWPKCAKVAYYATLNFLQVLSILIFIFFGLKCRKTIREVVSYIYGLQGIHLTDISDLALAALVSQKKISMTSHEGWRGGGEGRQKLQTIF